MKKREINLKKEKGVIKSDLDYIKDFEKISQLEKNLEISKKTKSSFFKRLFRKGLNSSPKTENESARFNAFVKRKKRKKILIIFTIVTLVGFSFASIFYTLILDPLFAVRNSINRIEDQTVKVIVEINNKDLSNFEQRFEIIQYEINQINKQIDRLDFLKDLEFTKGYYENLVIVSNVLNKTDKIIATSIPEFESLLQKSGFKLEKSDLTQTPNDSEKSAFSLILSELPSYLNYYKEIKPEILQIFAEIDKVQMEYIPTLPGMDLKGQFGKVKEMSQSFPELSENVESFVEYLPELTGVDKPTRYLLILQNETEMRASGGLLTAFGSMSVENGEFSDDISLQDTWNIERYITNGLGIWVGYRNMYGQLHLMLNGCGATAARAQDVGMYPDLNWTMNAFADYYNTANQYNPVEYPEYDHIIIINYKFAEDLLKLIQPLEVEGFGEVNAENLFDFIKEETDRSDLIFKKNRKDIIAKIADAAKSKFMNLELKDASAVLNTLINSFLAKDIALASPNENVQNYFDKFGMSGRTTKDFDGDYFHLNEAQNCSLKLNKFVRDTVQMNINIEEDGSINKEVAVKWEQKELYNSALDAQYSGSDQFTYRAWVRLLTPEGSSNFVSNGFNISNWFRYTPKNYFDEVEQKQINDNVIQFDHRRFNESDPIKGTELNVTYTLPESLNYNVNGVYRLLLQKHPGKSWGEKYNIAIKNNDTTKYISIILDQDKILEYRDGIITVTNYNKKFDWMLKLIED